MSVDSAENRQYVQKHRLWILGDAVTFELMTTRPSDPVQKAIAVLQAQQQRLQAPAIAPTPEIATDAKEYLQKHSIATLIEEWLRTVLEHKPEDPIKFSIENYWLPMAEKSEAAASDEKHEAAVAAP